jgi:hypothetical protein
MGCIGKGIDAGMLGWFGISERGAARTQVEEPAGVQSGLLSGTRVATGHGWRPVQALCAGDRVVTFDAGVQPLCGVTRLPVWTGEGACPSRFWPLDVGRGVLGNRAPVRVMPHQVLMLESDLAETLWGDPFALLPGVALEALPGVTRVPPTQGAEVVVLHFESEQVIFAENGLMALCPASCNLLDYAQERAGPRYHVLPLAEARGLVLAMARLETSTTLQDGVTPPGPWVSV